MSMIYTSSSSNSLNEWLPLNFARLQEIGHLPIPAFPGSLTPMLATQSEDGARNCFILDDWQLGNGPHFNPIDDKAEAKSLALYPTDTALLMRLGLTVAIEIVATDPETFEELRRLAKSMLGDTPLVARFSSPAIFLIFRLKPDIPFKKFIRSSIVSEGCEVNAYGFGHALPAAGKTAPVVWGEVTPLEVATSDLPMISRANIYEFLTAAATLVGADPSAVCHNLAPQMNFLLHLHDYWLRNAHASHSNGWPVVPIAPHEKFPAKPAYGCDGATAIPMNNWQNFSYDPIEHNRRGYQGFGIGLRLGERTGLIAIDCDNNDEEKSAASYKSLNATCGPSPLVRRGRYPRWTAIYRFEGTPPVRSSGRGDQKIEYNFSSQTVIEGVHPSSEIYSLASGAKSLRELTPQDLPLLTPEHISALDRMLTEGTGGKPPLLKNVEGSVSSKPSDLSPADQRFQRGSLEAVKAALQFIPNTPDTDWDFWNRMGLLIGVALNWEDNALELFDVWSKQSPKYGQKKTTPEKWFDREIKKQKKGQADYSRVGGARSIYWLAGEHGFDRSEFPHLYPDQVGCATEAEDAAFQSGDLLVFASEEDAAPFEAIGFACASAMGATKKERFQRYVLMVDDDLQKAGGSYQDDPLARCSRDLLSAGCRVVTAYPNTPRRFDGTRWISLAPLGAEDVRRRIDDASCQLLTPEPLSIEEARCETEKSMAEALSKIDVYKSHKHASRYSAGKLMPLMYECGMFAPHVGIKVGVGIGKTTAAINQIVSEFQKRMSATHEPSFSWVFAVPRHDLADEVKEKILLALGARGIEANVGVWRGADAEDPGAPRGTDGKHLKMCRSEHLEKAQHAGVPIEHLCKNKKSRCPHFDQCGYRRQKNISAHIWVVVHASLAHERPKNIPEPYVVVIDEMPELTGRKTISQDHFGGNFSVQSIDQDGNLKTDIQSTNDVIGVLAPAHRKLKNLAEKSDGYVRREDIVACELSAGECLAASELELRRKVYFPAGVDVSNAKKVKDLLLLIGEENKKVTARSEVFRALCYFMQASLRNDAVYDCGRLSVSRDREGRKMLTLLQPNRFHGSWGDAKIYLDATMRPALMKNMLPNLEVISQIRAEAPHQQVKLVAGKSFSHSSLKSEQGVSKQAAKVIAGLNAAAAMNAGKTLAIVPKFLEEKMMLSGLKHPRLHIMHHGAVSGVDKHKDCAQLIVVGRNLPSDEDAEAVAGALSGFVPQDRGAGYVRHYVNAFGGDGRSCSIATQVHPDALVEEVRQSICEDQLTQAVGRGRGVNRTEDAPLRVEIWGGTLPTDVPIHDVTSYRAPGVDAFALGKGIWVSSAPHLSKLHPDLKKSAEAVKQERTRGDHSPIGTSNRKMTPSAFPHLGFATYQLAGERQRPADIIWDPDGIPQPKQFLEVRLGALSKFEIKHAGAVRTVH